MSNSSNDKLSNEDRLDRLLSSSFSNIWSGLKPYGAKFNITRISVTSRGESDWFAVVGRFSPEDGTPQVCFASGDSFSNAMRQLNNAVSRDKWKRDKFAGS